LNNKKGVYEIIKTIEDGCRSPMKSKYEGGFVKNPNKNNLVVDTKLNNKALNEMLWLISLENIRISNNC